MKEGQRKKITLIMEHLTSFTSFHTTSKSNLSSVANRKIVKATKSTLCECVCVCVSTLMSSLLASCSFLNRYSPSQGLTAEGGAMHSHFLQSVPLVTVSTV